MYIQCTYNEYNILQIVYVRYAHIYLTNIRIIQNNMHVLSAYIYIYIILSRGTWLDGYMLIINILFKIYNNFSFVIIWRMCSVVMREMIWWIRVWRFWGEHPCNTIYGLQLVVLNRWYQLVDKKTAYYELIWYFISGIYVSSCVEEKICSVYSIHMLYLRKHVCVLNRKK